MLSETMQTKLGSKLWRLNNLYKIRDKDGKLITLRLNPSQRKVLQKFKHPKKVILKSRQQGISTLYLAYYLDDCLFKPGYQAGIQSIGQDEADKLSKRAELMWNELDEDIKTIFELRLVSNNQKGMTFSNGSILKIGNFRGDTLQGLHVSELGKIAKKYPEKARELKTGAFQAVGKNNKITIESTAEGKTGLFYEIWQKSMQKLQLVGDSIDTTSTKTLGPFDFQPIFLSWLADPDCNLNIAPEDRLLDKYEPYFAHLEQKLRLDILDSQRNWYAAKADELGDDMKQEYPSTPNEAFEQSIEGTYYAHEFEQLKIVEDNYDSNLAVYSVQDLGMNDDFSIIFFQYIGGKTNIIGEYNNSGHGLEHYKDMYVALGNKFGWKYGNTYVPHDIKVKELISGKTRWDAVKEMGFNPILVKKHRIVDGIEATRQFLKGPVTINSDCDKLIAAIQNYRKKYDAKYNVYLDAPQHDEFSHPADALRYLAMGLKHKPPAEVTSKRRRKVSGFSI